MINNLDQHNLEKNHLQCMCKCTKRRGLKYTSHCCSYVGICVPIACCLLEMTLSLSLPSIWRCMMLVLVVMIIIRNAQWVLLWCDFASNHENAWWDAPGILIAHCDIHLVMLIMLIMLTMMLMIWCMMISVCHHDHNAYFVMLWWQEGW